MGLGRVAVPVPGGQGAGEGRARNFKPSTSDLQ